MKFMFLPVLMHERTVVLQEIDYSPHLPADVATQESACLSDTDLLSLESNS